MKRIWLFISVSCLAVAAVALIMWKVDAAFVAAAAGAVCWFLDLRTSIREKIQAEETLDADVDDDVDENHEES